MADEPIVTQTVTQTTPRRRARDLAEGPLGPDELIKVGNVHRLVTHEMLYRVFPEFMTVGRNPREFKLVARRSHIRVMRDCTYDAMIAAVPEGFPVYYHEEFRRGGIPDRGKVFAFTLGFVKLLYARAVLGRQVDFSRPSGPDPAPQTLQTQTSLDTAQNRQNHDVALWRLAETKGLEARLEAHFEAQFQTWLAEAKKGQRQA
ncbi:hypothetical protein R1sor_000012 [Riccia sorocarpa]|uniref:Uncharacterized protein n=1 Tax=Riccia sorocarpa TaxID=122646 RepID=A0ABD3GRV5_9MARC